MHALKWVTGSVVADRVLYFCSSSYFGGAGVNYFKWWMTLFGRPLYFHWCTQEWVRVLLSLSRGEKVGVCVLSSINSTLWPTRPSAHPLLLIFPLVLPSTLVAWQYFHSLRSGCLGLRVLQLTPPSCRWADTLFSHTHPIYQLSLACRRWSNPIFLSVFQLLPLIPQTADYQILHC